MIGLLRGSLSEGILETSSGVGFVVKTLSKIEDGTDVVLRIHTSVRENNITLYGFTNKTELILFESLCSVVGIGPSQAFNILDSMEVDDIIAALVHKNPAPISKVKGVGIKSASRICGDIKLPSFVTENSVDTKNNTPRVTGPAGELEAILKAAGATDSEVRAVLSQNDLNLAEDLSILVPKAIAKLRKGA